MEKGNEILQSLAKYFLHLIFGLGIHDPASLNAFFQQSLEAHVRQDYPTHVTKFLTK